MDEKRGLPSLPSPLLCPEKEIELHRLLSENGGGYRERGGGRESGRGFFEEEDEAFAYPRREEALPIFSPSSASWCFLHSRRVDALATNFVKKKKPQPKRKMWEGTEMKDSN